MNKRNLSKTLLLPLFLIIFTFLNLFIFTSKASANNILFEDDFEDGNLTKWEVIGGNWTIHDFQGNKWVGANAGSFSDYEIQAGSFSWSDYEFSVDMLPKSGADKNIFFRVNNQRSSALPGHNLPVAYGLHLTETLLELQKWTTKTKIAENEQLLASAPIGFPINVVSKVTVWIQGGNIKVFINSSATPAINYTDNNNSIQNGRIALAMITGNSSSEVWFDNVVVTSLEPEPTPTPTPTLTPTPTPTPTLQPLILLPGLGGSWNHEEIFLGIDQPQSAWYKTPFINYYDGLIQTLQNAGFVLDENLFVFYYDWLQPIDQSANDLKNFINNVVKPPNGAKATLIGHSLGGLVGRTYIQNNPDSHNVDEFITVGSPHKGAPQVYKAWEGADLHGLLGDKERIGAGILLRLRGFSYPNLVQAIQNLVPSLGNLLFIDDYLKWDKEGTVKSESSMSQQNTWLKGLGVSSELLGLADTIVGTAGDTSRWLRIVERNQIDERLGRWEDGKPVSEEFAIGDRTVLEESAKLAGANIVTLAGLDHGDLVKSTTGQEKILELLGISDVEVVEQPEIPFEPALVFTVASPVTLRVTDPLGRQIGAGVDLPEIPNAIFSTQEKIIIIPQAVDGEYKVEVISENDGGSYQLLIGQLTGTQDLWTTYQGEATPSHPDTYTLPFDSSLQTTDIYLANLINLKLKNLLKEIRRQAINPLVKARLTAKVLKILGQTKPLSVLLNLEKDKLVTKFFQKAILRTTDAIDYAEEFNPDSLPPLREILDLLGQLHQLLES